MSALNSWITQAAKSELVWELVDTMSKEKRPQDWTLEMRLELVIASAGLTDNTIAEYCCEQDVFTRHVKRWKADFAACNRQH
jgi:transposase